MCTGNLGAPKTPQVTPSAPKGAVANTPADKQKKRTNNQNKINSNALPLVNQNNNKTLLG